MLESDKCYGKKIEQGKWEFQGAKASALLNRVVREGVRRCHLTKNLKVRESAMMIPGGRVLKAQKKTE